MIDIDVETQSDNFGINLLSTATRNYVSSRVLYMKGQLYDAGVFAHEAVEKIMKAFFILNNPNQKVSKIHDLIKLKDQIKSDVSFDLEKYRPLLSYYEDCYKYRYPDDPKPNSFQSSTDYLNYIDEIFSLLNKECLRLISDKEDKFYYGIYEYCREFFKNENNTDGIDLLLNHNNFLKIEDLVKAREYWNKKGYFVQNEDGKMKLPSGVTIRTRK